MKRIQNHVAISDIWLASEYASELFQIISKR